MVSFTALLGRIVRIARQQRGLTLMELLIVLAIIATLSTIGILLYADWSERARVARAMADIKILDGEITTFEWMNERLPTSLAEIGRGTLKDPWGNPYEYLSYEAGPPGNIRKDHALHPLNTTFDLYSKGRDGQSNPPLTAAASQDDVIRANDGGYVGLASNY
jgi:general secretion pathway protein G